MAAISPNFTMYDDNSQAIQLVGLFSLASDSFGLLTLKQYQNSAVVTATMFDVSGNPVAGLTNLVLPYVPGSNAVYTGQVGPSFAPTPGKGLYTLVVTAVAGGVQLQWSIPTTIVKRPPQAGL